MPMVNRAYLNYINFNRTKFMYKSIGTEVVVWQEGEINPGEGERWEPALQQGRYCGCHLKGITEMNQSAVKVPVVLTHDV